MEKAKITGSAPILLVANVEKSAEYYRDKIGFKINQTYGEPPNFSILSRDGFHLLLSGVADPKHIVPHYKVVHNMWNVYFWVDNIDLVYAELKSNGAEIDYEIEKKDYGVREFGIQDLDGYDIAFAEIVR